MGASQVQKSVFCYSVHGLTTKQESSEKNESSLP